MQICIFFCFLEIRLGFYLPTFLYCMNGLLIKNDMKLPWSNFMLRLLVWGETIGLFSQRLLRLLSPKSFAYKLKKDLIQLEGAMNLNLLHFHAYEWLIDTLVWLFIQEIFLCKVIFIKKLDFAFLFNGHLWGKCPSYFPLSNKLHLVNIHLYRLYIKAHFQKTSSVDD